MLVKADVKSLEIVVAAQLSGDPVLSKEILDRVDIHERNRDAFGLGEGKTGRLVAKVFSFRLIYGGSAYSYANDPDFMGTSSNEKFWQDIIDQWYGKYRGVAEWHKRLIGEAQSGGRIVIPSGRYFPIVPDYNKRNPWPLTIIKNYPVQGFGADLVTLARCRTAQLLRERRTEALLVNSIHDSIGLDTPKENVYNVGSLLKESVEDVPRLVKQIWNYNFTLPLTAEVSAGPNFKEMEEI